MTSDILKLCMVAHAHLFDFIFPPTENFFSNVTPAMELWNHRVLDWNHVTRHMEGSYGRNGTVSGITKLVSIHAMRQQLIRIWIARTTNVRAVSVTISIAPNG